MALTATYQMISRLLYDLPEGDSFTIREINERIQARHGIDMSPGTIRCALLDLQSHGWCDRPSRSVWRRTEPISKPEPEKNTVEQQLSQFSYEQLSAEIVRRIQTREA